MEFPSPTPISPLTPPIDVFNSPLGAKLTCWLRSPLKINRFLNRAQTRSDGLTVEEKKHKTVFFRKEFAILIGLLSHRPKRYPGHGCNPIAPPAPGNLVLGRRLINGVKIKTDCPHQCTMGCLGSLECVRAK